MRRQSNIQKIPATFAASLLGLFLLLLGTGLVSFGAQRLIRMWDWERLTLKNNSEAMNMWIRSSKPVTLRVYVFNVTNPEEVANGAKPKIMELGPYVYEQTREKVDIVELPNFTLSYKINNLMDFNAKASGSFKESDSVTVLNVPLFGAIMWTYEAAPEFAGTIDTIWKYFYPGETNIFVKMTVRDLLFDGIVVDCSSKISEVYLACTGLESTRTPLIRKEGRNFKYSFLHHKNGTWKKTYEVKQGIQDLKESAQIVRVNKSPYLSVWKDKYCDMINGSDGIKFPVMLKKETRLYVYEPDFCRSMYFEFEKAITVLGVNLYKYSFPESIFSSKDKYLNNECFCRSPFSLKSVALDEEEFQKEEKNLETQICLGSGLMSLVPCLGTPLTVSFPHFYLANETYFEYSNITPSKHLHENYVLVEPTTGVTVSAFKRFQYNVEVVRIEEVEITANLEEGIFPILWIEEEMELSQDLFKLIRWSLHERVILERGSIVLIFIGLFLIIVPSLVNLLLKLRNEKSNESLGKGKNFYSGGGRN